MRHGVGGALASITQFAASPTILNGVLGAFAVRPAETNTSTDRYRCTNIHTHTLSNTSVAYKVVNIIRADVYNVLRCKDITSPEKELRSLLTSGSVCLCVCGQHAKETYYFIVIAFAYSVESESTSAYIDRNSI